MLLEEAARINSAAFITDDPVQFPRRFDRLEDVEIAGLLCATIAWGNRRMICRNCDRLLALMGHQPFKFVMDEAYEDVEDDVNIHRTFFGRNLKHYLRGLRLVYSRYGSIDAMAASLGVASMADGAPWTVAQALSRHLAEANGGAADSRCLPTRVDTSALKRLNMWLRWMVRRDGIVDLGVWRSMEPTQLYIPLDVHVVDTARQLGLLTRKAVDRRAAYGLTSAMRTLDPADPARMDFALFGIGMRL